MLISVSVPSLVDGQIPSKYTCDGDSINPEIQVSGVTSEAQSLVLHVVDYDVPKSLKPDGTYHHWIVWNIDPKTKIISENSLPDGATEGKNTSGSVGYVGPCPPDREHRYVFRVMALDTELDLDSKSDAEIVLGELGPHEIDRGEAIGRYERQN